MSYGSHPDEVAEDYRRALEDLTMNSRYEISNLTVIAKENTEHALAISDALKNHIRTTAPSKKLPSFYVLDSVVKNVGTPYTIFLGRNLFKTFMEAYALVDNNVRRKMEEMLKTWTMPVPGSIDTRPVFSPDVTRPIESALIKARTSALQVQQQYDQGQPQILRQRPGMGQVPYRNTPTPPTVVRQSQYPPPGFPAGQDLRYSQPPEQSYGIPQYGQQPQYSQQPLRLASQEPPPVEHNQWSGNSYPGQQYQRPPSATPSWQQQQQQQQPIPQSHAVPDASLENLKSDIARLIAVSKNDFAQNYSDNTIQTRLKALLDLQTVLQTHKLPPDQLSAVRAQVDQLSAASTPRQASTPVPQPIPPPVQQPTQGPTLNSLFGQGALAALLARSSATPQMQTPPVAKVQPAATHSPQPPYGQPYTSNQPPQAVPPPSVAPTDLLAQLRAAGLLSATPTPASNTPLRLPNALVGSVPPGFPPSLPFLGHGRSSSELPNDVELKPASLKMPRPHLISMLYDRQGQPCTQCGRRFQTDEEGRKQKAAHMDWHFKVHQRMNEAEKKGQHRSWYVDEMDWIQSRESADDHLATSNHSISAGTGGSAATEDKVAPKLKYLPVPENPPNSLCPICQEKFEMKWLDDAQEFVWMDAVNIRGRIYHASCHSEVEKDEGRMATTYARATPDPESVLGKRKNEGDDVKMRTKIKSATGMAA